MPLQNDLDKILLIGSGPTLIGSVEEMDLLTKEAIQALTEEGIHVVLVNPNPATVSTDKRPGVTVYLEPMTLDFMKRILHMEEPDAIMTAYGSTTALKITRKLIQDGILQQMGIRLLTLNTQALLMNNEQKRLNYLNSLGIAVNRSWRLNRPAENDEVGEHITKLLSEISFPVLVTKNHRYVHNEHLGFKKAADLVAYFKKESQSETFSWKHYRLTEDLSTWEEVIVNVMRDQNGNLLFLNFSDCLEPVGINAGDSVVITPALTLNNDQVQKLRSISKKIVNSLNLVGILCLHFAVRHHGTAIESKILTITPRLTRSAIQIQRTGLYSVGYVLAKMAIGYSLNEITDPNSGLDAAIEPIFDQISLKMPYWSLSENGNNHYFLNKRMQASGEVMGIGRNFETAFLKGLASTTNLDHVWTVFNEEFKADQKQIIKDLQHPDEMHLIRLLAAIAKGMSYQDLQNIVYLHPVYYQKLQNIIQEGQKIASQKELSSSLLWEAKKLGFSNLLIAKIRHVKVNVIDQETLAQKIKPSFLQLDGSAGIYKPNAHSFYSAYGVLNEAQPFPAKKKVLIIGMLPLQVSVTSEFDYMIAHAAATLHKNGYATILLSNNDESVAINAKDIDRVYFEPINIENILTITRAEGINDVLLQFSGKKISVLSERLKTYGLHILGEKINNSRASIRDLLSSDYLQKLALARVPALTTAKKEEVSAFVERYGFPILIGGLSKESKQKSAVVYDVSALKKYLQENHLDQITASVFIEGNKYEVTAISDGQAVTIPGIIEHLEQTGSHASDSIAVFQPQNLNQAGQDKLASCSIELIKQLHLKGIFNLHFLQVKNKLYILQIKPYAGHNVAFLSKAVGKDITACATQVLLGQTLPELGYKEKLWPSDHFIHVKMPVFSYIDYHSDNTFDSKMKSSGSVMGRDTELAKALYKGYEASGLHIPSFGTVFISVPDEDKKRVVKLAKRFDRLGFKLLATEGTANIFAEAGITTGIVKKVHDSSNLLTKIRQHKIVMVVNITNLSESASEDAIRIRDQALFTHIPVFSSIETTALVLDVLETLALTTQPI